LLPLTMPQIPPIARLTAFNWDEGEGYDDAVIYEVKMADGRKFNGEEFMSDLVRDMVKGLPAAVEDVVAALAQFVNERYTENSTFDDNAVVRTNWKRGSLVWSIEASSDTLS